VTARPGLVLFLACLLAFDAATPLLPGAFRFDADESVDAVRRVPVRTGLVTPSLSGAPRPTVALSTSTPVLRPSSRRLDGVMAGHRPPRATVSSERGRSPSSPDDH